MQCDYGAALQAVCRVRRSPKHELECLRIAAEYAELARQVRQRLLEGQPMENDVQNRGLEIYLLQIAKIWGEHAERARLHPWFRTRTDHS